MKTAFGILPILFIVLFGCTSSNNFEIRDDLKIFYNDNNVEGSFILFNEKSNHYTFVNRVQAEQPFIPASTFKICNSLIGLETGVISDIRHIIHWDSVIRPNVNWNTDQDLQQAFKNSTVWYYQEVARQVGSTQMKYWLDAANYGNADTTGGIDSFWLTGGLRITPLQQVHFLKNLYDNQLPFSQRSMDIVKEIMVLYEDEKITLRGKTGLCYQDEYAIGWFIGYVETAHNVYFFSNCLQSKLGSDSQFIKARKEIAINILNQLLNFDLKIE